GHAPPARQPDGRLARLRPGSRRPPFDCAGPTGRRRDHASHARGQYGRTCPSSRNKGKSPMKRIVAALVCLSMLAGCGVLGRNRRPTTPTVGQRIPVLGTEGAVEADPLLAAIPVTVPPATAN